MISGLLTQRRFAPFFWTQALGAFNDNLFKNALLLLVTYSAGGLFGLSSDVVVNLAAMLFILPFFLFSAIAGQVADRYEKSTVIRWIKFAEVVIMGIAGLPLLLLSNPECESSGAAAQALESATGGIRPAAVFELGICPRSSMALLECCSDRGVDLYRWQPAAGMFKRLCGEAGPSWIAAGSLGAVSEDRLEIIREADAILIEELHNAGLYRDIQQAFVVLLPVQSVGVMGDDRTYENVAAIRAIQSEDFMTADWFRFPHEILQKISTRIINSVRGINRVVYDVSSKPPATIEWE